MFVVSAVQCARGVSLVNVFSTNCRSLLEHNERCRPPVSTSQLIFYIINHRRGVAQNLVTKANLESDEGTQSDAPEGAECKEAIQSIDPSVFPLLLGDQWVLGHRMGRSDRVAPKPPFAAWTC